MMNVLWWILSAVVVFFGLYFAICIIAAVVEILFFDGLWKNKIVQAIGLTALAYGSIICCGVWL